MPNHTPHDLPSRLAEKIDVDEESGCWNWIAYVQANGYGKVGLEGRVWLAHRATYVLLVGDIPDGLVIDHLCRNRRCVNPSHLRAVTQRENTLAPGSESPSAINASKTMCPLGHELTNRAVGRRCRTCDIQRDRERWPERSELRSKRNHQRWEMSGAERAKLKADVVAALAHDERLMTSELVERLMRSEDWRRILEPMTPRSRSIWLGRMIGVSPRNHNFGGRVNKGYRLHDVAA